MNCRHRGRLPRMSLNIFKIESADSGLLRLNKAGASADRQWVAPKNFLQGEGRSSRQSRSTKDHFGGKGYRGRAAQRLGETDAAGLGVPKTHVEGGGNG